MRKAFHISFTRILQTILIRILWNIFRYSKAKDWQFVGEGLRPSWLLQSHLKREVFLLFPDYLLRSRSHLTLEKSYITTSSICRLPMPEQATTSCLRLARVVDLPQAWCPLVHRFTTPPKTRRGWEPCSLMRNNNTSTTNDYLFEQMNHTLNVKNLK